MESQITLVDAKPTILTFYPNSMVSATVSALYTITTNSLDCTTITHAQTGAIAAKITRRLLLPDSVSFAGPDGKLEAVRMGKWMRDAKPQTPGGRSGHILETNTGLRCFICTHVEHRVALFHEGDPSDAKPLARWRLADPEAPLSGVALVLDGVPADFQLHVLVAFIILEHRMRADEKWSLTAEARVTQDGYNYGARTHGTGQYME
ncbi:hypothetical protein MIND_01406600 [Mycena indigotica]|uniref:DUF6593 domain-containing protein n=1 Tax=Mycena indigotica TaxID=2126181 RepID=A0A8H6RXU1_9AGAR|nr:uncharacterized protein MIND_01406600 [Mycena indigotica]KAF7288906.1 hypothetical protein MIND_01406600 [Mycena indigotica]